MGSHPPLFSFPQTTRGGVILSERAQRARAKDLLADAGGRRVCADRARAKDLLADAGGRRVCAARARAKDLLSRRVPVKVRPARATRASEGPASSPLSTSWRGGQGVRTPWSTGDKG